MRKMIIGVAAVVLILSSCGPREKKETKNWDLRQRMIGEYSLDYPGYASILEDKNKEWKTAWEQALTVADKKEKAQAMRDVNNSMTVVNLMMSYDRFERSINERIEDTQELIMKNLKKYPDIANYEITFRGAAESGLSVIREAADMVDKKPATYEEAYTYFRTAVDNLQAAYKRVDGEYDKIDRYIRKQESEKEEENSTN